jgi:hypothetical protein
MVVHLARAETPSGSKGFYHGHLVEGTSTDVILVYTSGPTLEAAIWEAIRQWWDAYHRQIPYDPPPELKELEDDPYLTDSSDVPL